MNEQHTSRASGNSPPTNRRSLLAGLVVVGVVALVMGVVIVRDLLPGGRAAFDQNLYHVMAVREFAAQWPVFDLVSYRSATTPGYHLALAVVARFVSDDLAVLRLAGSLFTLGLLVTLVVSLARRTGPTMTAALVLPVAASVYVFGPGVFLLPDNAAWWLVLGVMLLAMGRPATVKTWALAGAVLLLVVWARQIHIWAAGVVWFSAWLGASGELWPGVSGPGVLGTARSHPIQRDSVRDRLARALVAVACTMPAFVMLEYFVRSWGGLVPPLFQGGAFDAVRGKNAPNSTGGNPATPAFVLTLVSVFGVFFLAWFSSAVRRLLGRERGVVRAVALGAAIGLVLALVPRTSWSFEQGRYSGFWTIAQKLPVVAGRSLFITGGSAAGGAMLGLIWSALPRREAWILIVSLLGFTAAQTATFFAWQRYLEPMVLLVLVLAASRVSTPARPDERGSTEPRWIVAARVAGPVLLALVLAGIAYSELRQT